MIKKVQQLNLKRITLFILAAGLYLTSFSQGNNLIQVSGQVIDQDKHEPLQGISIQIKGAVTGTITDSKGKFVLKTKSKFPFTLIFSSVGYQQQEFVVTGVDSKLNIALATQTFFGKEVVVTASRVSESIQKSPVAIEKLDIRAIRESPAPSFYDALENVKGVQMITSSLTFKVPNTRGFNVPNNFRFMQLVDGVDMQSATLGVSLGNAIGPTELDIASVEITPGASAALYGMSAINGMANLITKSPFTSPGLSFYQKIGVNHLGGTGRSTSLLTETAVRFAQVINNKFAYKVNASFLKGTDWLSNTTTDQNPNNLTTANPKFPALNGANNVAYDAWNKYGDDAAVGNNAVSISKLNIDGVANKTLNVARTGYWEKDLVQPEVRNLKFDAGLYYRLTEHTQISYDYRVGQMDGVFQRGNKIQLNNAIVQNHKIEIKGNEFVVRGYVSIDGTGNSYNLKPLADNLDLYTGGSNSNWATKYTNALNLYAKNNGGALTSSNLAAANVAARLAADAGRAEPGTARFDSLVNVMKKINNWDVSAKYPTGGADLVMSSFMYNLDAQWDLSKRVKVIGLLVGADERIYQLIPDGNNFVDFRRPVAQRNTPLSDGTYGKKVYYEKYGAFVQATKSFLDEKLKVFASLRGDYNPYFDPKFTPRVAAVYTYNKVHNFRFTFQQGYRFPSLFEALSFVNNSGTRRVGSLPFINQGLGFLDNSYYTASYNSFKSAVQTGIGIDTSKTLLQKANLPNARPEKITSFEVGYKSVLLDNKLVIDFDAYTNVYNGFLGQVNVVVDTAGGQIQSPGDATAASLAAAIKKNPNAVPLAKYKVYTNAKDDYNNYGASLGITYSFYQKFVVNGAINYNKISNAHNDDVFQTGFNTPDWSTNIGIANREIFKNVGFNVIWKWQNEFLWQSQLVNGTVGAFSTFDAQANLRLPKIKGIIKLGATDLLNTRYIQYAGGPTIGALIYTTFTIDGLLTK